MGVQVGIITVMLIIGMMCNKRWTGKRTVVISVVCTFIVSGITVAGNFYQNWERISQGSVAKIAGIYGVSVLILGVCIAIPILIASYFFNKRVQSAK